jgi:hypothetical protein
MIFGRLIAEEEEEEDAKDEVKKGGMYGESVVWTERICTTRLVLSGSVVENSLLGISSATTTCRIISGRRLDEEGTDKDETNE